MGAFSERGSILNVNSLNSFSGNMGETNKPISKKILQKRSSRGINKLKKESGKTYVNQSRHVVPAKEFTFTNCRCILRCDSKLDEETRRDIFNRYWAMGSYTAREQYIANNCRYVSFFSVCLLKPLFHAYFFGH